MIIPRYDNRWPLFSHTWKGNRILCMREHKNRGDTSIIHHVILLVIINMTLKTQISTKQYLTASGHCYWQRMTFIWIVASYLNNRLPKKILHWIGMTGWICTTCWKATTGHRVDEYHGHLKESFLVRNGAIYILKLSIHIHD